MGSGRKGNRNLAESDAGVIGSGGQAVVSCFFEATVPAATASGTRGSGVLVERGGDLILIDADRVLAVLEPTSEVTRRIVQCIRRDYGYRGILRSSEAGPVVDVTPS